VSSWRRRRKLTSMSLQAGRAASAAIHQDTEIGAVHLTVSEMDRSRSFYEHVIGLHAFDRDDGTVGFGPTEAQPLLVLRAASSAPALDRRKTGLYHLAILVPSRVDLALALARLIAARWPLDGASDHLVSEALYLSDPDGNGIEIYRDRPRHQWRRSGDQLEMATLPLDLQDVMSELATVEGMQEHAPSGTMIGHVHLQVSDLREAEAFYGGILGFDVMVRGYPGALFVSAGGYHHHIGLNTWHSAGAAQPESGAIGLRSFEVTLPNAEELDRVLDRVRASGLEPASVDHGYLIRDPAGNGVLLRSAVS
jgi:catechol 2,3-dioxygenase